jgi:hypothetical protein
VQDLAYLLLPGQQGCQARFAVNSSGLHSSRWQVWLSRCWPSPVPLLVLQVVVVLLRLLLLLIVLVAIGVLRVCPVEGNPIVTLLLL